MGHEKRIKTDQLMHRYMMTHTYPKPHGLTPLRKFTFQNPIPPGQVCSAIDGDGSSLVCVVPPEDCIIHMNPGWISDPSLFFRKMMELHAPVVSLGMQ
jgi:hypothetical protein